MKNLHAAALAICAFFTGSGLAQQSAAPSADRNFTSAAPSQINSPAAQSIEAAESQIEANPKRVQAYNDLAQAYLRRARETADTRYLKNADDALTRGLAIDPGDFQLQKTQVALMLCRHEYAEAKEKATALNHRWRDDVSTYGYMAEADIALGNYADAETNTQWMLNMLPNNIPALMLGARLRMIYGEPDGAIDFLNLAYTETSPAEVEELAWIANQIAVIEIDEGKLDAAAAALERAEQNFPHYAYTLENRSRMRLAQHRPAEAAKIDSYPSPATERPSVATPPQEAMPGQLPSSESEIASRANKATHESLPTAAWTGFAPVDATLLTPRATETERTIRSAQAMVARNDKDAQSYAALGAAYFQRARETGDVSDYELADQALTKSLDLDSADFPAAAAYATMAEVCMGEHRFTDALTYAQKALSLGSGDVSPFAIVGDAYADMGEYDKARAAYARLTPPEMTLSPRAAYARDSRLSYLQFIAGDAQGAIRLMKVAVAEGSEAEIPSENLAWLYFELGEYSSQAGDAAAADTAYLTALKIHPGDYRALAGLARLRANHGRYAEAIELYRHAIAVVPMPIFVTELGDLYAKAGNSAEARKQFQLVEYIGQLGRINQVLHNRDLALYYADHDTKLSEALSLAQREFEVRHDIYTWDALAWALYKNGKYAEAAKASENALKFGTPDALLLYHAGVIAEAAGDKGTASVDFKKALEINPNFHVVYAGLARQQIARLDAGASESAVNHGS